MKPLVDALSSTTSLYRPALSEEKLFPLRLKASFPAAVTVPASVPRNGTALSAEPTPEEFDTDPEYAPVEGPAAPLLVSELDPVPEVEKTIRESSGWRVSS